MEILPSYINLYDSPNNYILNKNNIFDAEGVPTKRKTIIKNGILNSVIGDLFSSYQYNVDCSGNSKAIFPFYHDYTMSKTHLIWDIRMKNKCKQENINYEIINFTLGAQFNNITGYFEGTANYKDNTQNPPRYNKCQIHIHYTEIFKYLTEVENYEWFGSNYIPEFIIHFDKKENNS
jgi:hypothetical protein